MSGHAKMPPASHQVSATSLKLMIQQIHPHVRVERDSGMCVARDLYELCGRMRIFPKHINIIRPAESMPVQLNSTHPQFCACVLMKCLVIENPTQNHLPFCVCVCVCKNAVPSSDIFHEKTKANLGGFKLQI